MDKWLWAARFFKTRALAARACELGRVTSNGQPAKSARPVRVGDLLQVKTEGGDFQVEVLLLSEVRGPGRRRANTLPGNRGQPRVAPAGGGGAKSDAPLRNPVSRETLETQSPCP